MTVKALHSILGLLFVSLASASAFQAEPSVEVLIPKGMPMTIDVHRDQDEPQILKYVFNRHAKGAHSARITVVMLDESGSIRFTRTREGNNLSDPMTIATADSSVARILLIVEALETKKGTWLLDPKGKALDVSLFAKSGGKDLPKATFIPK